MRGDRPGRERVAIGVDVDGGAVGEEGAEAGETQRSCGEGGRIDAQIEDAPGLAAEGGEAGVEARVVVAAELLEVLRAEEEPVAPRRGEGGGGVHGGGVGRGARALRVGAGLFSSGRAAVVL
jgi:hypothetical protein